MDTDKVEISSMNQKHSQNNVDQAIYTSCAEATHSEKRGHLFTRGDFNAGSVQ